MRQGVTIFGSMLAVGLTAGHLMADSPRTGPAQSDHNQIQSWQIENWRSDSSRDSSGDSSVKCIDPLTIVPIEGAGRINVTGGLAWPQAAVSLPSVDHTDTEVLWSTPPVVPLPPAVWGGIILGGWAIHTLRKQRSKSKARLF